MRRTSVGPFVCAVVLGAALPACSDQEIIRPEGAVSATAGAAVGGGGPPRHPNAVKYRDQGHKPATGRAGSAQLSSRALLGREGAVHLELTTGSFEGAGTPTGQITHLQLKHLADQQVRWTKNESGLRAASLERSFAGLRRGDQLQVQANIRTPRGRTGVVTVGDVVRLRPDPYIRELTAPTHAQVGQAFVLNAVVAERNTDVGARTDCVLYVDGTEADRANGIWVDAGGVVTCSFMPSFSVAGTRVLEVRLANVRPADFDPDSNSRSVTVEITEPTEEVSYVAWASSWEETYYDLYSRTTRTAWDGTSGSVSESWYLSNGPRQSAVLTGAVGGELVFPLSIRLEHVTGGKVVAAYSGTSSQSPVLWTGTDGNRNRFEEECVSSYEQASSGALVGFMACARSTTLANGEIKRTTWHSVSRNAGEVTYWGRGSTRRWDASSGADDTYTYNYSGTDSWTGMIEYGPEYQISVSLEDAASRRLESSATIPMQPHEVDWNQPDERCYEWSTSDEEVITCSRAVIRYRGVTGTVISGNLHEYF